MSVGRRLMTPWPRAAEQRRAGPSGAVRAAEALDGDVGPPAGLQQVVHAPRLIRAGGVGVVAAPGAARGGEDQDLLGAVHERGRFGEVRGGRARRDGQTRAAGGRERQDAARAAGDFGDDFVAEVVHEDVDGGRHGRQGAEFHHQAIAGLEGVLGLDRVAEVVAWRIFLMTLLGRDQPDLPARRAVLRTRDPGAQGIRRPARHRPARDTRRGRPAGGPHRWSHPPAPRPAARHQGHVARHRHPRRNVPRLSPCHGESTMNDLAQNQSPVYVVGHG